MKLIELDSNDTYTLYEFDKCRITVSNDRPKHLCLIALDGQKVIAPSEKEIGFALSQFMHDGEIPLPHIMSKMFTAEGLHIWEKTKFTMKLVFQK